MSDDLFNEGREFNLAGLILTIVVLLLIAGLGLYFTGNLPIRGNKNIHTGNITNNTSEESPINEVELTENETSQLEKTVKKVVLIKHVTYKTDDGSVIGVVGYLGIKSKYYDNILRDLILSVQNLPAKDLKIYKKVFKENYKGYVIVYFKILPVKESINVEKLDFLVLYMNVPYKYSINLNKNVKIIKSDVSIEMQYSVPKVGENPVKITITFSVFSKYKSKVKSVINEIVNSYQKSRIVMSGDVQYFMSAVDYEVTDNSISITYQSPYNVQSGVYTLKFKFNFGKYNFNKNLGKIIVINHATEPSFIDIDFVKKDGKIVVHNEPEYKLLIKVVNNNAQMSLPMFRFLIYDSNSLTLVKEVSLDGQVIGFGENIVGVNIPDSIISSKSNYYIIVKIMAPDETIYTKVLEFDSNNIKLEGRNTNMANVKFLVFPTQYYANYGFDYVTGLNYTGYVPVIALYPANSKSINVKIKDMYGNAYTTKLTKVTDYSVSQTEVVPLYAGMFRIDNVPMTQNYVINVEFPDGSSVFGSVNLFNIYYNADTINEIFNKQIVKNSESIGFTYQCDELDAFNIVAIGMGLSTENSLSEYLNNILLSKLLFSEDDISISTNGLIIKVDDGVAHKILWNNWVSYTPIIAEMSNEVKFIIGQNENPVVTTTVIVDSKYSNGNLIINAPFISSIKYIYLYIGDKIIPLNWIRSEPDITSNGFDYSIYTYLEPSVFKINSDTDLYNIMRSAYDDNPIAQTILTQKVGYITSLLYLIPSNENSSPEYNNQTVYTNSTISVSAGNETVYNIDFIVGIDKGEKINSVSLNINGVSIPISYDVYPGLDYDIVAVHVKETDVQNAMKGVTLSDLVNGKHVIKLEINGKVFYNIIPEFSMPVDFMLTDGLLFLSTTNGADSSVLMCNGNSIAPMYDVSSKGTESLVYNAGQSCTLSVKSDLFGNFKLFP